MDITLLVDWLVLILCGFCLGIVWQLYKLFLSRSFFAIGLAIFYLAGMRVIHFFNADFDRGAWALGFWIVFAWGLVGFLKATKKFMKGAGKEEPDRRDNYNG